MTDQPFPYHQTLRGSMLSTSALPQPRPQFFLSRSNTGLLVPLVPADELPFNISLQGVSRVIRAEETSGMQCVGYVPYVGTTYKLEREVYHNAIPVGIDGGRGIINQTGAPNGGAPVQTKFLAPDHFARQALAQSSARSVQAANNGTALTARPLCAHETATSWRSNFNPGPSLAPVSQQTPTISSTTTPPASAITNGKTTSKTQELINAILSTTSGARTAADLNYTPPSTSPPPPSGNAPDSEKKQYCTYWIRTGECDYIQQGCLYRHEMPDRETLESIGFRNVPRWWGEKNAGIGGMRSSVMIKPKAVLRKASNGIRTTVGKPRDVKEWLKKSSNSEEDGSVASGSESGNTSLGSQADDENSETEQKTAKVVDIGREVTLLEPLMPAPSNRMDSKQDLTATSSKQPEVVETKVTASTAAAPTIDIRKASTCSDLIDLADPASPATSASPPPGTPALTPATSVASTRSSTPLTPQAPAFNPMSSANVKVEKKQIFIPKGESILPHIHDVRNRQLPQRVPRAPALEATKIVPLEKQIQEKQSQHARAQAQAQAQAKTIDQPKTTTQAQITIRPEPQTNTTAASIKPAVATKPEKGLMASQHAPKAPGQTSAGPDQQSGAEAEMKAAKKTGTRGSRKPTKK